MSKLVIFDVDNTIVFGQSQKLLLSYLFKNKKVSLYYYVLVYIWFVAYKLQIAKDPRAVVSFAYFFLKGKSRVDVDVLMDTFFRESLVKHIFPEALVELKKYKESGNKIVLVSNAPMIIIQRLANYLGVETYFCTQLEVIDDTYTGAIIGDIMYGDNKRVIVEKYASEKGYSLQEASAYGDHVSDLPILEIVGHPVAVNPTATLKSVAISKGWEIHNWHL